MWAVHSSSSNDVFFMLCNATYLVGKEYAVDVHNKKTEIGIGPIIRNAKGVFDSSISRNHAKFKIVHKSRSLGKPDDLPVVELTDTDSKYGTYLNNSIDMEKGQEMKKKHAFLLRDGFRIRFGKQWNIWKLQYTPLVVLMLNMEEDPRGPELENNILLLGGHVVDSWSSQVTHITMTSIKMSVKVVCALAKGIPIVTPDFWVSWVSVMRGQGHRVPVRPISLPDPAEFLPQIKDPTLNSYKVSLAVNPERRKLFASKMFVFVSGKQLLRMASIIAEAGGDSMLFGRGLSQEQMCEDNVIVVNNTSNTGDTQLPGKLNTLIDLLALKNKRVVPESEITLAVLYNSIATHCNPNFVPASLMRAKRDTQSQSRSSVVLAPDTCEEQEVKHKIPPPDTQMVAETLESPDDSPFSGSPSRQPARGVGSARMTRSCQNTTTAEVPQSAEVSTLRAGPSRDLTETQLTNYTVTATQSPAKSTSRNERTPDKRGDVDMENLSVGSSMLTFKVDDAPCTLPKSLKTRRQDDEEMPASKHARLMTSSDDDDVNITSVQSQDAGEVNIKSSTQDSFEDIRDKAEPGSDDDDLFGFEETDDIANILNKNKVDTVHKEKSRKRQNTQEERETFAFKSIKLPRISALEDTKITTKTKVAKADSSVNAECSKQVMSQKRQEDSDDEGWMQAEHFPSVKLEDGTFIDAPVVTSDTLVQVKCNNKVKVPITNIATISISRNVKPFKKSWHPLNTGLPNIISMSELQGIHCRSGEVGLDATMTAQIEETERQRRMQWDFNDKPARNKTASTMRGYLK